MAYGPPEVLAAPPLAAPAQGLLVAAQVIDHTDERWYNGTTFSPEHCGEPEVWAPCSDQVKGTGGNRPAVVNGDPFFVVTRDACSAFSWQTADYQARARRAIQAKEGWSIEREFWTGALVPANRNLAEDGATTVGTGMGLRLGLATLVQAIADRVGGRGMIHARPLLVEQWAGHGLLRMDNGRLVTAGTGVPVAAGAGYPGTGPTGQAIAGGVEWAFATESVIVHRGPVIITPDGDNALAEATNKSTNVVEFRAERGALVQWGGCVHVAASINVTTE